MHKQAIPQDRMTSPRYMDPQRKTNDIIPLKVQFITISEKNFSDIVMTIIALWIK